MLKVAQRTSSKTSDEYFLLFGGRGSSPFFGEYCFDTVVSSLSACTFPNPAGALQEMARVCRTDGKILLLEHGRSHREWLGRWQDRHADKFAKPLGCHWNREPLELTKSAGLKIIRSRRSFFGIFHRIEAESAR